MCQVGQAGGHDVILGAFIDTYVLIRSFYEQFGVLLDFSKVAVVKFWPS